MGASASIPASREEALDRGFTIDEIDAHLAKSNKLSPRSPRSISPAAVTTPIPEPASPHVKFGNVEEIEMGMELFMSKVELGWQVTDRIIEPLSPHQARAAHNFERGKPRRIPTVERLDLVKAAQAKSHAVQVEANAALALEQTRNPLCGRCKMPMLLAPRWALRDFSSGLFDEVEVLVLDSRFEGNPALDGVVLVEYRPTALPPPMQQQQQSSLGGGGGGQFSSSSAVLEDIPSPLLFGGDDDDNGYDDDVVDLKMLEEEVRGGYPRTRTTTDDSSPRNCSSGAGGECDKSGRGGDDKGRYADSGVCGARAVGCGEGEQSGGGGAGMLGNHDESAKHSAAHSPRVEGSGDGGVGCGTSSGGSGDVKRGAFDHLFSGPSEVNTLNWFMRTAKHHCGQQPLPPWNASLLHLSSTSPHSTATAAAATTTATTTNGGSCAPGTLEGGSSSSSVAAAAAPAMPHFGWSHAAARHPGSACGLDPALLGDRSRRRRSQRQAINLRGILRKKSDLATIVSGQPQHQESEKAEEGSGGGEGGAQGLLRGPGGTADPHPAASSTASEHLPLCSSVARADDPHPPFSSETAPSSCCTDLHCGSDDCAFSSAAGGPGAGASSSSSSSSSLGIGGGNARRRRSLDTDTSESTSTTTTAAAAADSSAAADHHNQANPVEGRPGQCPDCTGSGASSSITTCSTCNPCRANEALRCRRSDSERCGDGCGNGGGDGWKYSLSVGCEKEEAALSPGDLRGDFANAVPQGKAEEKALVGILSDALGESAREERPPYSPVRARLDPHSISEGGHELDALLSC